MAIDNEARRRWLRVVALTLLGGVLRLWRLDHQSLWLDEVRQH